MILLAYAFMTYISKPFKEIFYEKTKKKTNFFGNFFNFY